MDPIISSYVPISFCLRDADQLKFSLEPNPVFLFQCNCFTVAPGRLGHVIMERVSDEDMISQK